MARWAVVACALVVVVARPALADVYPVDDLVLARPEGGKVANFRALIEAVEATGGPNGWDETGGMRCVGQFRPSLSLVISQTDAVHDEIEKVLATMRRERDPGPAPDKKAK